MDYVVLPNSIPEEIGVTDAKCTSLLVCFHSGTLLPLSYCLCALLETLLMIRGICKQLLGTSSIGREGRAVNPCCLTHDEAVGANNFSLITAYGINSILYQRGVYPAETFTHVQKYGLTMLVTADAELKNYLNNVVGQLKGIWDDTAFNQLTGICCTRHRNPVCY